MNYISLYNDEIKKGKIIAGKKIKTVIEKLSFFIDHPEENYITHFNGVREYFVFVPEKANIVIDFIERFCRHVKGTSFVGKPILLELWQKAMISALYGFVSADNGLRKYRKLHLYVGRKNGKTLLAACLIIFELLIGGEIGAECYTGATKQEQAKITWDMAKLIIHQNPSLEKRFSLTITGIYKKPFRDSFFKTISKESKKLDGLNAHLSHIDELHAITDTNIIDVMWDSTKSRLQPIELITTTMGIDRQSTFDEIYEYDTKVVEGVIIDERLLVFCYELDEGDDWQNINNAFKANPNLGVSQSINQLHEEIQRAISDRSKLINLLCKTLNLRQSNKHSWLSFAEFNNEKVYPLETFRNQIVIGAFDLSRTNDLTAFTTLLFDIKEHKIIAETMYWCTQKYLENNRSKVPIQKWIEQGYMRLSGIELIDYKDIISYVKEVVNLYGWRYMFINYDPYSAGYLINEFEAIGYAKEYVLKAARQGAKTLSVPLQELEANLKEGIFSYQNNPITKWCFSNVELEQDRNGNFMPIKTNYERKIDGVMTILDAYVSLVEHKYYFLNEH